MQGWSGWLRRSAAAVFMAAAATAPASAQQNDIVLGALLALTGPAAPIGLQHQQGIQFAVDLANEAGGIRGRKVRMIFEDSQGKPDQGVLAFNRLADFQKVPAFLTSFSSVSLAIAPLATRKEILALNAAAQSNKLGNASPYLLNTIPLVRDEGEVVAKFAYNKLGKKVVIIYENAAAGIDGRDDFKKSFEALGGQVIGDEAVEFGQTNYRPTLLKTASLKPDFVYVVITQGQDTFAEQVSQIPGFPVGLGTTFVYPFAGYPSMPGWHVSIVRSDVTPELEAEFKKRFKLNEFIFASREYFNSTNILLKAVDHILGKNEALTGANLRKALFEIKTFKSGIAEITFDSNTAKREITILRNDGGGKSSVVAQ